MPYVDFFIVDVKILVPILCRDILGGNVAIYLQNMDALCELGKPILLRLPCNHEHTLSKDNLEYLMKFFAQHPALHLEIFATHSLGKTKYESLGLVCPKWQSVTVATLEELAEQIRAYGLNVTVKTL